MVASKPTFHVVLPWLLGSSEEPAAPGIFRILSACILVATAHSTCLSSNMSMSSSTIMTCFMDGCPVKAAMIALTPSPSLFLEMDTTPFSQQHPPSVRRTFLTLGTACLTVFRIIGSLGSPIRR
jgi:hypothetical protein